MLAGPGLTLVIEHWHGVQLKDDTHWREVEDRNWALLQEAEAAGVISANFTDSDARTVLDGWGFPLHSPDLRRVRVARADLLAAQEQGCEQLERDYLGY